MELTTPPGHTAEDGFAGFFQAGMVVAGDEFNTRQPALNQAFEK